MSTYSDAGVSIDAGNTAVELMKAHLAKARRPEVVGDIGGFAGLFDISAAKNMKKPLLATSTDGVGTKTEIARALGKYDTIGEDVGGETAEHPGLLDEDEFDIAGAATGIVDEANLLGEHRVKEGDVLIAMPASGFHANGFSLVRHIIKTKNLSLDYVVSEYGKTSGEVFLTPTEIYALDCLALTKAMQEHMHAYSHITGGGIAENTARVIPSHLTAVYDRSTWSLPVEMEFMASMGGVPQEDMERTWNCGIGMTAILSASEADRALRTLAARGMKAWVAGVIEKRDERGGNTAGSTLVGHYKAR